MEYQTAMQRQYYIAWDWMIFEKLANFYITWNLFTGCPSVGHQFSEELTLNDCANVCILNQLQPCLVKPCPWAKHVDNENKCTGARVELGSMIHSRVVWAMTIQDTEIPAPRGSYTYTTRLVIRCRTEPRGQLLTDRTVTVSLSTGVFLAVKYNILFSV